jgi:RNA-directed DNA polymerase
MITGALPTRQKKSQFLGALVPKGKVTRKNKGMKRVGKLFDHICSLENLRAADVTARKGKKDQYGIKVFDRNKEANLLRLHDQLINKTFTTSPYTVFQIYDPKERDVSRLPYYPDRIVHHAVMNRLEPIFVSCFTADTFASVKGKGVHAAGEAVKEALRDRPNTMYCLKLDVKKFYPSVDHDILKQLVRRKIKDPDLLWLLDDIIDSAPGLPIGNYLSQFLANYYLSGLDHYIKEELRVESYFRYMDDMVILAPDKSLLHQLLGSIRTYLSDRLNLDVKSNYQVFPVDSRGIDYLGYVYRHDYTLMRKSIKKRFVKAVIGKRPWPTLAAYWGWAKHCNSNHLIKKLLNQAA